MFDDLFDPISPAIVSASSAWLSPITTNLVPSLLAWNKAPVVPNSIARRWIVPGATATVTSVFDAVSADMERYVQRFATESLAMKNIHHIHEPTALSIQQIITLIVPPEVEEGTDDIFDF